MFEYSSITRVFLQLWIFSCAHEGPPGHSVIFSFMTDQATGKGWESPDMASRREPVPLLTAEK
jgi:hypothetical protein